MFSDDGSKRSVLEGSEVYNMLNLYMLVMERDIVMVSCLLTMKALDRRSF